MRIRHALISLMVIAISSIVLVSCGGSDESSSSTSSQSTSTESTESSASQAEPSAQFLGSGRNGKLAKVGKEASEEEREAASQVLEDNFNAREAGDWQKQCQTLASAARRQIEEAGSILSSAGCAKALKVQAEGVPASVRANTMTGPIDALRINQGVNGLAFYHGKRGKDYVIPLLKESGEWKVVALTTEEVP